MSDTTTTATIGYRPPITVLVVDDHEMVAKSILRLLRDEPDMDLIGVASSAQAAPALAVEQLPDIVITTRSPTSTASPPRARRRDSCPATNVVLLTGTGGMTSWSGNIEAGCSGFLQKTRAFDELARAVRLAAGGECPPARPTRTAAPKAHSDGL
jgi:DNA-binding NarL/FixJ family response regulator